MPSRMSKLARRRKALKKKERIAKKALKLKMELLKKDMADMKKLEKENKALKRDGGIDINAVFEEEDRQKAEQDNKDANIAEGISEGEEGGEGGLYNLKGLTLEEQLAELEKSDQSDFEALNMLKKVQPFFSDAAWKNMVALFGTGLVLALIFITLELINALLAGGFSDKEDPNDLTTNDN